MKNTNDAVEQTVEPIAEPVAIDENATIDVIADSESSCGYSIVDNGNTVHCLGIAIYKDREVLHLPDNSTCRVWIDRKKVDAAIAADGKMTLGYKGRIKLGVGGTHYPQEKLIAFLSEEEQAEYKAIVDKARQAMADAKAAAKAVPLTPYEKAKRALERAQAKLAELEAAEASNN